MKQAPPQPLSGSTGARKGDKGKRRAPSSSTAPYKAAKGFPSKDRKDRPKPVVKGRRRAEGEEEEPSDMEEALQPGDLSEAEDEEELVKVKSMTAKGKGKAKAGPKRTAAAQQEDENEDEDLEDEPRGRAKQPIFSDDEDDVSEGEGANGMPIQHVFDLDEAPDDDDEELGDEFDIEDDDDEDMEDGEEEDSAFASDNEEGSGDEDEEMADDEIAPHLRQNPAHDSDEEDAAIATNMEDDLEEDYTLPAVDRGGEQEEQEHGVSLKDVESRMRWLVGVCMNKGEKTSKGVAGKCVCPKSCVSV